ncbi:OmpP1/FadL family transporter [Plebeiibacterium sediminum]|uniref:Outer membrane protein transport protein n=1 Tax=Plebeiibacterium sediminum TaxID=2992112 RepID=A0AAE3SH90_9BACT|nr:outer membrane protein transport protein [Plebeiobacterium sediminum]MCW3788957.1 outer membrane protein transport protein [Plebeiobacterium sediminum]
MKKLNRLFLITLCLLVVTTAKAIDGYHMLGYGTVSKGMGGVGAAYYRASIVGNNPAGRAFLDKQYTASLTFLFPSTSYTVTGAPSGDGILPLVPGKVESDVDLKLVPNLGANWRLSDNTAFGLSVYGTGIAADFPTQTFYDPTSENTSVTFNQLYLEPSYAIKFGEKHAFGISALLMCQTFEVTGIYSFGAMSQNPEHLSNNGMDYNFGAGFKIGYMGEILKGLNFGVSYQSRTFAGKLSEYAGLLAEDGKLDAPSVITAGLNYQVCDKFKVLFDVQKINFSEVKSLGNSINNLLVENNLMGSDNGPGFGWEDMTVFKVGAEFNASEKLALRAGYAYGNEPVQESEVLFNILASVVNNQHITLGATKKIGAKGKDLNLALVYAPANNVKGPNSLDPAQQIDLELGVFEIELGITF